MKIHDNHMYHGAALLQIAEHPSFKSINAFSIKSELMRNAFQINKDIAVCLKYASKPKGRHKEYVFTFNSDYLAQLSRIDGVTSKLILGLVCVAGREICALSYTDLVVLIQQRRKDKGEEESQYTVLLTLPKDSAFRVYVSPAGTKGQTLGKPIKVARNRFPNSLFRNDQTGAGGGRRTAAGNGPGDLFA